MYRSLVLGLPINAMFDHLDIVSRSQVVENITTITQIIFTKLVLCSLNIVRLLHALKDRARYALCDSGVFKGDD